MKYIPFLWAAVCLLPASAAAQNSSAPQTTPPVQADTVQPYPISPQPLVDSRPIPISSRSAQGQSLSGGFIYFPKLGGKNPIFQMRSNVSLLPKPGKVGEAIMVRAQLHLEVPIGAEVWMQGKKFDLTDGTRLFQSPPLPPGDRFVFEVRVKWTENGRLIDQSDRVEITAGDKKGLVYFGVADGNSSRKAGPKGGES